MRKVLALAVVALLVQTAPAHAATTTVAMRGLQFQPAVATWIGIADTVHWTNGASDRHSTTSPGPTPWDSGRLNPWGGHYDRVFPIAGSFPYYCTIHRSTNMLGTIKVATKVAPMSGTTATTFVVTLAKSATKPPPGFAFVLQRALGSGAFTTVATTAASTVSFRLGARDTYKLRSGLQKTGVALNAKWFSDPVTISVS